MFNSTTTSAGLKSPVQFTSAKQSPQLPLARKTQFSIETTSAGDKFASAFISPFAAAQKAKELGEYASKRFTVTFICPVVALPGTNTTSESSPAAITMASPPPRGVGVWCELRRPLLDVHLLWLTVSIGNHPALTDERWKRRHSGRGYFYRGCWPVL